MTTPEPDEHAGSSPAYGHYFSVPLDAFRQLAETGVLPPEVTCTQCGQPRGRAPH